MKKILQRIGLLAAAVMLLWGWQGIDAQAADSPEDWTVDLSGLKNYNSTFTGVSTEWNGSILKVRPIERFWFAEAPHVICYYKDGDGSEKTLSVNMTWSGGLNEEYHFQLPKNGKGRLVVTGEAIEMGWISVNTEDEWQLFSENATDNFSFGAKWDSTYYNSNNTNISVTFMDEKYNEITNVFTAQITGDTTDSAGAVWTMVKVGYATEQCAPEGKYYMNLGYEDKVNYFHNLHRNIAFYVVENKTISQVKIAVEPPVAGQSLPSEWQIGSKGVYGKLTWQKNGVTATGNADPNSDYVAELRLYTKEGYTFSTGEVTFSPDDYVDKAQENGCFILTYKFTTADIQRNDSDNDISNKIPDETINESVSDTYRIINGAKSTWNGSTSEGLTIRGDGDFEKFAGVRVDGNWIPSAHYEAKSGSTIVTLKPSYLASLSEGEHTVDIMWIDDSASTTFTVAANTAAAQAELDSVPKTGEGVMGWMPEALLLVAAGLTIMGALRLKKSKIDLY